MAAVLLAAQKTLENAKHKFPYSPLMGGIDPEATVESVEIVKQYDKSGAVSFRCVINVYRMDNDEDEKNWIRRSLRRKGFKRVYVWTYGGRYE